MAKAIDNRACSQRADGSAQTVGHQHEQALGRCLDVGLTLLIDEDTARDIEEVKCHTINQARHHNQDDARPCRVTSAKEAEPQYPGEHSNQHNHLDAITLEEERNEQDAQRLGNLRERHEHGGVVCAEGVGHRGITLEMGQVGRGKSVGHLQ